MGDSSDNIPGVPGVGEKTAVKLIQEFGSLENLYDNLDQVSGKKVLERLTENREQAFMSRELGRIVRDIDMGCDLSDYQRKSPDIKLLRELYRQLEFSSLLQHWKTHRPSRGPIWMKRSKCSRSTVKKKPPDLIASWRKDSLLRC
jgi:DNA polymerase-1